MNQVKQISVFLENKAGRLAKVTDTLAQANINIHALSLADTSDFGILRMIVSENDLAKKVLKEAGFTVGSTEVIAVEIPHTPGGLNGVLNFFSAVQVNIEYMYAFVHKNKAAILVFRCHDVEKAVEALTSNKYKVITSEEIELM
jgi:hypothetical protein